MSPVENDLHVAGIIFWCTQKKLSRGCLRVRPDANANADADADADADANRSKTICRPPLKGVDIIHRILKIGEQLQIHVCWLNIIGLNRPSACYYYVTIFKFPS